MSKKRKKWLNRLLKLSLLLAVIFILTIVISTDFFRSFGSTVRGDDLVRLKRSPHFNGKTFANPVATQVIPKFTFWGMMKRWWSEKGERRPRKPLAIATPHADEFRNPPPTGIRLAWLGHSTVLLEVEGVRILTDPVWAKRCSPSSLAGPKRFHPPPLAIDDLPHLDAIIISHDHYDHLDRTAVKKLACRGVLFITSLGVGSHLKKWGIPPRQIRELDWWESHTLDSGSITITATPARHFSGRGLSRNRTFWSSWVILGKSKRIFFCGDTGMFPGFTEIAEKYSPFDLTLLKIGAYDRFWPDVHLHPRETLEVNRILQGKTMLPIHWGTFNLAFHPWQEPIQTLLHAAKGQPGQIITPRPGQVVDLDHLPAFPPWWEE